ncbi:MAG TPA: dienelactone hydrolase family protein [Burkholderiales bacterium]|jgi:carboxymethylenebutenolidase|nr:dienelactone hydrolase family protein [Burkholderiales bacterium]
MGKTTDLTAADGHKFSAYVAEPSGKAKGALIVVMEIFGVNSHIKRVTDEYAGDGYLAIAPAFFDRVQRGLDIGYTPADIEVGRGVMQKMKFEDALKDVEAAKQHVAAAGKVGIIGYCWGGSLSFKSACNVNGLACAVAYYGGAIPSLIGEKPKCPVLFNWGETDASIPLEKAKEVAAAHKDHIHHFYPGAGHGFNCEQRGSYNAEAAKLARTRSLEFLKKHIG